MLAAIKSIFLGERNAPADAVPRALLQQLATIPRLTGILPYLGWMPDEQLFVLDQTAFGGKAELNIGFCVETTPQTGASDEMEKVLASLFMSCPTGTGIQVTLYASPDITPILKKQKELMSAGGEVFSAMSDRRSDFLMNGVRQSLFSHHTYLLRNFRCLISISLPLDPKNPGEVDEAIQIKEGVHATLRSAHLPAWDWQPNDLLNFAADFFDPDRIFKKDGREHIEYDDSRPLRTQISSLDVAASIADNGIKLKKADGEEIIIQTLSVKQYPKYFRLGNMGALIGDYYQAALSIPCPFIITMGGINLDYESARTKAQLKSARATQAAGSQMARFQPDLQDRKRDWDMVLRAFDNGRNVIQMYHQVILLSTKKDASKSEYALRAVWRARGFNLTNDIYLAHQALSATLPMTLTAGLQADLRAFGRVGTKTADNAIMTSPLIAEWKGTETPVLTLFGRRGQIMSIDLFDNNGGNYNFAVAALSGSGKSVLVNEMAFRYLGAGTKVWIIDVGRSYRNLCSLLDGEFIEFSDETTNKLCINPFTMVENISEDMEMLHPLIAQMASPREQLDNYKYSSLSSAIKRSWDSFGKKTTITNVFDLLRSSVLTGKIESELVQLAAALEPYTKNGIYSSYFEGEANIRFDKNFIVLELEELKAKKDLQAVVMQLMMYRITQEMYLDRSRRKLAIIDEAWDLMGNSASAAEFIEAGYRRARKYKGSFGTITQSVEDYYKNDATKAAIQNADWLFLLRQKPESIERLGKEGKLHVDEWMKRQLLSVTTEHGYFSEIFINGPGGSGIGRLILDPFSMMLYSTRAEDFEAIKALTGQGLSITEAVDEMLRRNPPKNHNETSYKHINKGRRHTDR